MRRTYRTLNDYEMQHNAEVGLFTRPSTFENKDSITMQNDILRSNREILSEHYDLGELIRKERITRGYINDSFEIEVLRDQGKSRYLLRRYRTGTHEEKIRFEHALLNELQKRKFKFSPLIIATKEGTTYVKTGRHLIDQAQENYAAIFSYLPGKDKYSWDTPFCSDRELINAAKILALYHNTIYDWKGIISWKAPSILNKIKLMAKQWKVYARNTGKSPFDIYFLKHFDYLLRILTKIPSKSAYDSMPRLAIHGDYHPGNLKFQNGKVTGVFDFDWSRMDARCLDVGLAIIYFCSSWDETRDGNLLFDRVDNFLASYQEAAKEIKAIGPLNQLELEYLPEMIHMGNLSLLDWTLSDFYSTSSDPRVYLKYLRHSVRLNRWLESNYQALTSCVQKHNLLP
jgi:homoserine kinase type II